MGARLGRYDHCLDALIAQQFLHRGDGAHSGIARHDTLTYLGAHITGGNKLCVLYFGEDTQVVLPPLSAADHPYPKIAGLPSKSFLGRMLITRCWLVHTDLIHD